MLLRLVVAFDSRSVWKYLSWPWSVPPEVTVVPPPLIVAFS